SLQSSLRWLSPRRRWRSALRQQRSRATSKAARTTATRCANGTAPTSGKCRSVAGEFWRGGHLVRPSPYFVHPVNNALAAIVRGTRRRLEALTLGCARRCHSNGVLIKMFAVAIFFQRSNSPPHHIQPGARNNDITQGRE